MAIYFKDVQDEEKWGIELGYRMTHTLNQIDYEESLALLTKLDGDLKKGMTLYPGDQILIRQWDDIVASWYLLEVDVR